MLYSDYFKSFYYNFQPNGWESMIRDGSPHATLLRSHRCGRELWDYCSFSLKNVRIEGWDFPIKKGCRYTALADFNLIAGAHRYTISEAVMEHVHIPIKNIAANFVFEKTKLGSEDFADFGEFAKRFFEDGFSEVIVPLYNRKPNFYDWLQKRVQDIDEYKRTQKIITSSLFRILKTPKFKEAKLRANKAVIEGELIKTLKEHYDPEYRETVEKALRSYEVDLVMEA